MIIADFIRDVLANSQVLQILGLNNNINMLNTLNQQLAIVDNAKYTCVCGTPSSDEYKTVRDKIGIVVTDYLSNWITQPSAIRKMTNGGSTEYWVSNYGSPIAIFDANWSFLRFFPAGVLASYTSDFAIDTANNRLVVAMSNAHLIRAFDLTTGAQLWEYGVASSPGHWYNGRCWYPHGVEIASNGNVIFTSYYGNGVTQGGSNATGNLGFVGELDGATGAQVFCSLAYDTNGFFWENQVRRPAKIRRLSDGRFYICSLDTNGEGAVGVFNENLGAYWDTHQETYSRPPQILPGYSSPAPRGVCFNHAGDQLVIAAQNLKYLYSLGLVDHDLKWTSGALFSDRSYTAQLNNPSITGIGSPWDVVPTDDVGFYAVADYDNRRILILPEFDVMDIQYVLDPYDTSLYQIYNTGCLDDQLQLHVPINKLDTIPDKICVCLKLCSD